MATRLTGDDDLTETHEINVTPFIDVMLVLLLLIIFMVAAPLATVDVKVDKPLYLTVRADKSVKSDKSVKYGALMEVMDGSRAADSLKVALVGLEGRP